MAADNVLQLNLSRHHAEKLLREIAKDSSRVFFSTHATKRMTNRKISRIQVFRCLTKGHITEGPARGSRGNWELKMEVYSAGEPLSVVAVLDNDGRGNYIIIVTVYGN